MLSEFIATKRPEHIAEFDRYDENRDGTITAAESVSRTAGGKLRFRSDDARVFEAQKEGYSELLTSDDILVSDVDVQLSFTKIGSDEIELHLLGTDGFSAALYVMGRLKLWGKDRLFEKTLIDDEAPEIKE